MNLDGLTKLSGDASFRDFYRKKTKNNSIFIYAKKQKKKNLLIYSAINNLLLKKKIKAPRLISHNYRDNYIEIEDLGNHTIYDIFKKKNVNKIKYYFKIIFLLDKLQKIREQKIKTFQNSNYYIPIYSNKILFNEFKLFLDWYLPKVVKKNKRKELNRKLTGIIKKLLSKLKCREKIFVHRDFHVSNLMEHNKEIYIIDSQDALYGNISYDLASLIDDVRFRTSNKDKEIIFQKFMKVNKYKNFENFKNDFEILSVLRNLKIIGIFQRLYLRDKKKKYLKLIPYAWNLIEYRIKKNKNLLELKTILEKYFLKRLKIKK